MIMYCSNFERTTADAQFFESLLCLARLVVAAAVAESSLSPEVGDTAYKCIGLLLQQIENGRSFRLEA